MPRRRSPRPRTRPASSCPRLGSRSRLASLSPLLPNLCLPPRRPPPPRRWSRSCGWSPRSPSRQQRLSQPKPRPNRLAPEQAAAPNPRCSGTSSRARTRVGSGTSSRARSRVGSGTAAAPEAALAPEQAAAESGSTTAVESASSAFSSRGQGWVPLGQVFRPVGDSPLRPRPGVPLGLEPRRMPSFSLQVPRALIRRAFGPGRRNLSAGDRSLRHRRASGVGACFLAVLAHPAAGGRQRRGRPCARRVPGSVACRARAERR